jgi:hypothetical protein
MADGDVTKAMSDELGLRLEDADENNYTQATKIIFLSKAQRQVASFLHDAYLTELENKETDLDISSLHYYPIDSLNSGNGILRGGIGIKRVKIDWNGSNSTWCNEIDADDLKDRENQYLEASDTAPMYYIFNNRINVLCDSYTYANLDVYYQKLPDELTTAVDPVLNIGFQDLIITLAEANLWRADDKPERREAAYQLVMQEIEILNRRYRRPEGIGTQGRVKEVRA